MSWTTRTLGEICDEGRGFIRTGPFGSQLHESDYSDEGTPVVMPKDLIEGKISENSIARVSHEHVHRLAQHKLLIGDIVYGRRGDIGRQALITRKESGWLCGTGCLRISLGSSPLDAKFLHYFLRDARVIDGIAKQAVGATMPNLNTSILRSISITYPPVTTQRWIAAILSAYDDLIENNTRRIQILEEMARRMYEEWFVRFRFPGHESASMAESELGVIPRGWNVKRLGEIAKEVRITVEPSKIDPSTPYVGLEHIPKRSIALTDWGEAKDAQSTKHVFKAGNILFGKIRPYFHKVSVAPLNGVCSSDAIVIEAKTSELFPFVLGTVSNDEFVKYATQTSNGVKMPRANWTLLLNYPVFIPTNDLMKRYGDFVELALEQISNLTFKLRNLRQTRDLLLPKLISGEIDVSNFPEPLTN